MILNGKDTKTGDSIIMPIDISTLATTRSITKNGMKIMKPIWKAVFSSLVMKVGTKTDNGTSSALTNCGLPESAEDVPLSVLEQTFIDRKSTRLNSSHQIISYAVLSLKK